MNAKFRPFLGVPERFKVFQHEKTTIMDDYVLILRHEDGTKLAPPEQLEIWRQQTQDWIRTMEQKGQFISAVALPFDEAWVIWPEQMVTNGPFGDRKQTIGGMIRVKADSHEEVTAFAKLCPALQGEGNSVEVRKIAPPYTNRLD